MFPFSLVCFCLCLFTLPLFVCFLFVLRLIQVESRDSLNSIALKFDTTPNELVQLNKLFSRAVVPGQVCSFFFICTIYTSPYSTLFSTTYTTTFILVLLYYTQYPHVFSPRFLTSLSLFLSSYTIHNCQRGYAGSK